MIDNTPIWLDLDCRGELSGFRYTGRFFVKKYLTGKDRTNYNLKANKEAGALPPGNQRALIFALARLDCHIEQADAVWWTKDTGSDLAGLNLVDDEPVFQILEGISKLQDADRQANDPEGWAKDKAAADQRAADIKAAAEAQTASPG
jgi:hypothetical protein